MTDELPLLKTPISRRRLLQGGAALAAGAGLSAYLPASVRKALAQAPSTPFDVSQVKHVVLLMQENRSFDNYFGTLAGVRGFGDPAAITLPNGNSVFFQPAAENPDGYLLPWHLDTSNSSASAMPDLSHQWQIQHAAWNGGAMDGWVRAHTASDGLTSGPFTMGYYEQDDIPFQFALANNFTICDRYHCSVMGPTHPNRYYWMTGTVDPEGLNHGPALDNSIVTGLYDWITMAEICQNEGISWKCYQQLSTGANTLTPKYNNGTASSPLYQPQNGAEAYAQLNNYGTNVLIFMSQFQAAAPGAGGANPNWGLWALAGYGSTLWGGGPSVAGNTGNTLGGSDTGLVNPYTNAPFDLTTNFEEDCYNGTLPQVSWIFPPAVNSEHPSYLPAAGAEFVASKLAALAANTDLWNSTVFIIDYDENDGMFDHVPPITPPAGTANELVTLESPGGTPGGGLPVGSGFRVPCVVVSPWTTGGYVYTAPLDHTSCLMFLEQVFFSGQAVNPNISDWRRATFGNFLSVFQSGSPSPAPSDSAFTYSAVSAQEAAQVAITTNGKLPTPPAATQVPPMQQSGTRPSLP
ncbi:MAG TPA: alkaline phosphatase family protein [Acidimicrobiales bacterium]|nr:alkaline phosphatase family protein [Acidimicrobiales bacterium]